MEIDISFIDLCIQHITETNTISIIDLDIINNLIINVSNDNNAQIYMVPIKEKINKAIETNNINLVVQYIRFLSSI